MPLLDSVRYRARRAWLFLDKGPAFVGAFLGWYARRWARARGWLPRPWRQPASAFWGQFDPRSPALAQAAAETSEPLLLEHFRRRTRPRFCVTWAERASLSAAVGAEAVAATVAAADQVVRRTFAFRGQPPVTFAGAVDWTHQPDGNTDWRWDLNRHFYFVTLGQALWYTGEARYAAACAELLADWLSANPADEAHPNWSDPFEVACRITTWLWAYHLLLAADALTPAAHALFLRGLWMHGAYLDACLELHVPNNHLLLEVKALAMLGLLLPEFAASERWRARGLALLEREVRRQTCADGAHAERVPHYHRLVAGELLELARLLDMNAAPVPAALAERLPQLAAFELHLQRPDGRLPLFGDSAHGDPHIRFQVAEAAAAWLGRAELKRPGARLEAMTVWLVGTEGARRWEALPAAAPAPSRLFREGGYAVLRTGWQAAGRYLALDCGPFGYPLAAGHGHADALSVEVFADGQPRLVDSGVYSYHLGRRWRQWFRGTRAHNTVVVDGQDQSELLDEGRVWRPARVTVRAWASGERLDWIDAEHDGYQRLPGRVRHRRRVVFVKPDYWLIVDDLAGAGRHAFEALFHLPPETAVTVAADTGAAHAGGLAILPLAQPGLRVRVDEGWVSFRSGEKQAAPVLTHSLTTEAPARLVTILAPLAAGQPPPALTALSVDQAGVCALAVDGGAWRDELILDARPGRHVKQAGRCQTDAALSWARWNLAAAEPAAGAVWAGTHLSAGRSRLDAAEPAALVERAFAAEGKPV